MPDSCIRCNGAVVAELDDQTDQFKVLPAVLVGKKILTLIEQINQSQSIVARIIRDELDINIDSSSYNPDLAGIAPGYVLPDTRKIYAKESLPAYFLYVVLAFEVVNYSNKSLDHVEDNPESYATADEFANACESAEYLETYQVVIDDIKRLVKEDWLDVPWYVPHAMERDSWRGAL